MVYPLGKRVQFANWKLTVSFRGQSARKIGINQQLNKYPLVNIKKKRRNYHHVFVITVNINELYYQWAMNLQ